MSEVVLILCCLNQQPSPPHRDIANNNHTNTNEIEHSCFYYTGRRSQWPDRREGEQCAAGVLLRQPREPRRLLLL